MKENEIAQAITDAARLLGNGDADTSLGAIEALGRVHQQGMDEIASSLLSGLHEVARAIETLAYAVEELKNE